MKRLTLAAIVCLVLGSISYGLHHFALPLSKTYQLAHLQANSDGLLVANISANWPLKINKTALDDIEVTLPDGSRLTQYPSRIMLIQTDHEAGFYINRPDAFLRLPAEILGDSNTRLEIQTPVKLRDIFYKVFFSASLLLLLWSWIGQNILLALHARHTAPLGVALGLLLLALAGGAILLTAEYVLVWLGFFLLVAGLLGAAIALLRIGEKLTAEKSRSREPIALGLMTLCSVLLCLALAEGFLAFTAGGHEDTGATAKTEPAPTGTWFYLPEDVVKTAQARSRATTLPKAWERQDVDMEGATKAYLWHGSLHVHDDNGFRRTNGPFPEKVPGKYRIMVVGDSLTYGYGVSEEWTYSSLLQSALESSFDIEIFNLGRSGYQSEDVLAVAKKFAPVLQPDLVVYAVCLNDFLPSGQGEYHGVSLPLPEAWKQYLLSRTRLAHLINDAFQGLLLAVGIRKDFYDDILSQETDFRARFARDVAEINRLIRDRELPPVLGMVFHQMYAGNDDRPWQLIDSAEDSLAKAGFDLVSIKSWRKRLQGQNFPVSRWEGHPNELANSLVAEALYRRILERNYLSGFEKASSAVTPPQGDSSAN